ncbi:DNA polymerase III subunit gamma/tau [Gammaproteobacteria bacterium]|nr:DNA polymerase III subunit gamma/tau [Gammaproteobacteria bacterium]
MSYEVLARKYRPTNFDEVVGQDHIIQALSNSILQDRMHQAFIFSGTRGVGKTTLGRILAKCLNCLSADSPISTPCNTCSNCEEIKLGRSLDFFEQDAASQRGIDAMKDLLQTVPQSPSNGRFKVYLLDEAHMLTTESFNALLKNLEEPPKHIVFILATTNPEKLPKTVQSRCLQLNLKTVGGTVLINHLKMILESENINFDHESIELIADAASGSVRDALTLLDQAIAHGSGSLEADSVKKLLGTIDNSHLISMLHSIIDGKGQSAFNDLAKIEELSPEYESILKSIISILHKTSLEKVLHNSNDENIKSLSQKIDEEFCQLLYEISVNAYSKFNVHPNPKEALEICILRMLAFNPLHKLDEQPKNQNTEKKNLKTEQIKATSQEKSSIKVESQIKSTITNIEKEPIKNEDVAKSINISIKNNDQWIQFFDSLEISPFARNYFGYLEFESFDDLSLVLISSHADNKIPENVHKEFKLACEDYFKKTISIEIKNGNPSKSPIHQKEKQETDRQLKAEKEILSDPSIQKFLDKYDGNIKDGSIKPIN